MNQAAIGLLPRAGGEYRPLVGPGFGARALPGGFIYFALRGELHPSRFDAERGVVGRSLPQVSNVAMDALMGQVHAAASDTGLLVFAEGGDLSAGRPVWMDRAGHVEELPLPAAHYNVFHLGPGDRKLALQTCDLEDYVLVADFEDGSSHRLGLSPAGWPTWSSDGSSLYVSSRDGDVVRLGRVDPCRDSFENLAGVQNAVTAFFTDVHPTSGALVDVWRSGTGGVNLLRPDSRELTELVGDGSSGGQFSPDGSLLAYVSYDTGAARIRVRTFPDGDVDVPVSGEAAVESVWCRACSDLYFHDADTVYSVEVSLTAESLHVTAPAPVWFIPDWVDSSGRSYDVSEDGARVLYMRREHSPDRKRVHLVHNWPEQLRHLPALD